MKTILAGLLVILLGGCAVPSLCVLVKLFCSELIEVSWFKKQIYSLMGAM